MSVYDQSPSVGAYTAEPLSVAEIDAHPDRDRIWATIMAIRADNEAAQALLVNGHADEIEAAEVAEEMRVLGHLAARFTDQQWNDARPALAKLFLAEFNYAI